MSEPQIDLRDYRQPVVTSLGVILGFLLGFLGQWVTEETFVLKTAADLITFLGCTTGAILLLVALFRMLSPSILLNCSLVFYRRTIRIYLAGVTVPLGSIFLAAFIN